MSGYDGEGYEGEEGLSNGNCLLREQDIKPVPPVRTPRLAVQGRRSCGHPKASNFILVGGRKRQRPRRPDAAVRCKNAKKRATATRGMRATPPPAAHSTDPSQAQCWAVGYLPPSGPACYPRPSLVATLCPIVSAGRGVCPLSRPALRGLGPAQGKVLAPGPSALPLPHLLLAEGLAPEVGGHRVDLPRVDVATRHLLEVQQDFLLLLQHCDGLVLRSALPLDGQPPGFEEPHLRADQFIELLVVADHDEASTEAVEGGGVGTQRLLV
mmetsp:Transcript_139419/g.242479  ORF Transcript_139419/g.242479 Transcript_139419/m.242479 type:complete len:268 (+) Transcript_139419:514-1317(+)